MRLSNLGLALVHAGQALLMLVVGSNLVLDATRRTGNGVGAEQVVLTISVGGALAVFFLAAALYHGSSATLLNGAYEADLRRGRNRGRWVELAVSSPILMVLIALFAGVTDIVALAVVVAASVVMVACGWMQESWNPPGRRTTTMVPFWCGVVAGVLPWLIIGLEMLGAGSMPKFSFPIFLTLGLMWAAGAVNQWLQYHQVGPWADYLHGEKTNMALSLVAKSAVAWQLLVACALT
ncbi:heliorhodopsin HeR [Nocardioides sp.]|uniref:heliorhodopsin HeR n=1 Tax=Nocardioides sp. TaxID=35761 RepID=UPI003564AD77